MAFTPRADQQKILDELCPLLAAGTPTLVTCPTGFGKGSVMSHLMATDAARGKSSLLLVHLQEIVRDTAARVRSHGCRVRVVMGSEPEGEADALVTVASVQTMAARGLGLPVHTVHVDEAHRTRGRSYQSVLARHPGATLCGWSATGERSDGTGLGKAGFREMVVGPQISEMVEAGTLAPMLVFVADEATDGLSDDPVVAWAAHSAGLPGIVFASSVEHSRELAARFCAAGYAAVHVDGDTPTAQRKQALADFAAGAIDIVCNFRLLVEGWDVARASVIMLAGKVSHPGTMLQMLGRGRRWAEGKVSRLIDLVGAVWDHGFPDLPRFYSLEGRAVRVGVGEEVVAVQCRNCLAWGTGGVCKNCGYRLPPPPPPRLTKKEIRERRQAMEPRTGPAFALWRRLCLEQETRKLRPQYAFLAYFGMTGKKPKWTVKAGLEG